MPWTGVQAPARLAWLMLNSLVASQEVTLRWHGKADLTGLLVLFRRAISVGGVRWAQLYLRCRYVLARH